MTVDVFTKQRFGGNPLAVFPNAVGLTDEEMQALAAEFNLSETVFILPPAESQHTARVRIFSRTTEMPFAGHPNVGAAYVLAREGHDRHGLLVFEEIAGLVRVEVARDAQGEVTGATIAAPGVLERGMQIPVDVIARCADLSPEDILTATHRPVVASLGISFVLAEVAPHALAGAMPNLQAFREAAAARPEMKGRFSLHLYAKMDTGIRARMFGPLSGTVEDAATGWANATLGALLLVLSGGNQATYHIVQGRARASFGSSRKQPPRASLPRLAETASKFFAAQRVYDRLQRDRCQAVEFCSSRHERNAFASALRRALTSNSTDRPHSELYREFAGGRVPEGGQAQ